MTGQGIYDTRRGIEEYVSMAEGFDGTIHVERLGQLLQEGAEVLELGMGPGVDLDMLSRRFQVVGSDLSQVFLDRYAALRPDAQLLQLDAVTIDTEDYQGLLYQPCTAEAAPRQRSYRNP